MSSMLLAIEHPCLVRQRKWSVLGQRKYTSGRQQWNRQLKNSGANVRGIVAWDIVPESIYGTTILSSAHA